MEQLRTDPDILKLPCLCLCFAVPSQREVSDWLTPLETLALRRINAESRQQDWLAGRLAAKELVRHYLLESRGLARALSEIEIVNNQAGAPLVRLGDEDDEDTKALQISISHSAGHGLAGLCEGSSIGVDLQEIRPVGPGLSERVLSRSERAQLAQCARELESLIAFWALKEATIKAHRTRPSPPLHEIEVRVLETGRAQIFLKDQRLSAHWGERGRFIWACALSL
jgi:phosphopantetheinyl transferase (holo-ACP synthase)